MFPMTAMISPFWAITNMIARKLSAGSAHRFPVPVISVGNIVAGGAGKTEIAIAIANHLILQKKRVVIATRGYRSGWSDRGGICGDFQTALSLKFPDEALVALYKAKGVSVAVGKNRTEVLRKHWEELSPDVIILDDGYQHFKIKRDLDILVHDFSLRTPVLRDFPTSFYKAGIRVSFSEVPKIWTRIDWVKTKYRQQIPEKDSGVTVVCGIGNPQRFTRMLKQNGVQILGVKKYHDHHQYTQEDVKAILKWKNKISPTAEILTTQKDWVKFHPFLESQGGLCGFAPKPVEINLQFLENEKLFWRTIDAVGSVFSA